MTAAATAIAAAVAGSIHRVCGSPILSATEPTAAGAARNVTQPQAEIVATAAPEFAPADAPAALKALGTTRPTPIPRAVKPKIAAVALAISSAPLITTAAVPA